MEFNSRLTKELCELYGPTGREHKVAQYIQEQIRGHVMKCGSTAWAT